MNNLATQTQTTEDIIDALQMRVQPLPLLMPDLEGVASLAHYPDQLDLQADFQPTPRELLVINTSDIVQTPLRYFRVIKSFERVHLFFFLPHGQLSRFERLAAKENNELTEIKEMITQLMSTIEANQVEARKAAEAAARQAHQAALRSVQQRSFRRLPLDPVVVGTSIEMSPRYNVVMAQYYMHLIGWRDEFTFQQQLIWGQRAREITDSAIRAARSCAANLSESELAAMIHWLKFCITDPGMWMLKPNNEGGE